MSCIKSFIITSSANETGIGPAQVDTWGVDNYWIFNKGGTSTFNIEGFKNINIHSIEAQGDVASLIATGSSVIVNDWSFIIQVNGQNPIIGGNITAAPNNYSIVTFGTNQIFSLSRYNPKFCLDSPIQSVTSINIQGLRASGYGAENLLTLNLAWFMNFIVYYSFEGE